MGLSDIVSRNNTVLGISIPGVLGAGLTNVNVTRGKCTSCGVAIHSGNNRSSRPPIRSKVNRVTGIAHSLRKRRFGTGVPRFICTLFAGVNGHMSCPTEVIAYGL